MLPKAQRLLPAAAAASSGVLMALALPLAAPALGTLREIDPAGRLEVLAWVALVPAVLAVRAAASWRAAAVRGLVAGVAFFYGAIWWVSHAMTAFGGLPGWLAFVALTLLVLYMAVHWAAAFAISWKIRDGLGWPMPLHLPVVWVALELCRNYLLTGFPWANLGYTQARTLPVAQLAALGGPYAIAALVVAVNAALAEALAARRERRPLPRRALAAAAALLALAWGHGVIRLRATRARMAEAPRIVVGVVQPNLDQSVKNEMRDRAEYILSRLVPLTLEADRAGADLVAWPEATYPLYVPPGIRSFAGASLPALSRAHLLMGAVTFERSRGADGRSLRSVGNVDFLLSPSLDVLGVYQKQHLVPFGEYVPLHEYLGFLGQVVPSLAPAAPGRGPRVLEFAPAGPIATATATSTSTATPARAPDPVRLPGDQRRVRAAAARARDPREPHERRLVRLLVGAVPVPRHRAAARDRGREGGGPARVRGGVGGDPADGRARAGRARRGTGGSGPRPGAPGGAGAPARVGAALARPHPLH
jgi:apolipoprotein N-acyltransferase